MLFALNTRIASLFNFNWIMFSALIEYERILFFKHWLKIQSIQRNKKVMQKQKVISDQDIFVLRGIIKANLKNEAKPVIMLLTIATKIVHFSHCFFALNTWLAILLSFYRIKFSALIDYEIVLSLKHWMKMHSIHSKKKVCFNTKVISDQDISVLRRIIKAKLEN